MWSGILGLGATHSRSVGAFSLGVPSWLAPVGTGKVAVVAVVSDEPQNKAEAEPLNQIPVRPNKALTLHQGHSGNNMILFHETCKERSGQMNLTTTPLCCSSSRPEKRRKL